MRIVSVHGASVSHEYFDFGMLPETLEFTPANAAGH
jgi:hypothetical protein